MAIGKVKFRRKFTGTRYLMANGNGRHDSGSSTEFAAALHALHSHEDHEYQDAYETLLNMGSEIVQHLVDAFAGVEGRARLSVIRLLGELGDGRAVGLLLSLMRTRDEQEYVFVPSLAAKSLGRIGQMPGPSADQAIAGLVEALNDNSSTGSRRMSALVLGNVGSVEAVPALTAALGDEDRQVRALAARALGRIGAPGSEADRAVSALIVRLSDHDRLARPLSLDEQSARTVSEAAAWALAQIDNPGGNEALNSWRGKQ
jgi:HEAT repeat protein